MTTPTTNYAWGKPVVGADANTWGTEANAIYDAIDTVMFGKIGSASPTFTGTVAGAALSFTGNGSFGGTLAVTGAVAASGVVTISQGGIGAGLVLNQTTPATYNVDLNFNTSGAQRWVQSVRSAALTYDMWFFSNSLGASVLTLNNATGVVSAPYGITANVTGNLTGNATTATVWATGRTFTHSGDATGTSATVDGSGNATLPVTLATVNANVGSFTNASITVNAKGLITAASSGVNPLFAHGAVTSGGALSAGLNVASTARTGVGVYTVTFTVAASSVNYSLAVGGNGISPRFISPSAKGTAGFTVNTYDSSGVAADVPFSFIVAGG